MYSISTAFFDQWTKYSAFFHTRVPLRVRAICIVLSLLLVTFFMGWITFISHHKYVPMAVLGIFFGVVLSYPATMMVGPRVQSALGGALGGFSVGNISHLITHTTSSLESLAHLIALVVQQILAMVQLNIEPKPLADAILVCLCLAIITMLLIIATSIYLTNDSDQKAAAPEHAPVDQPARVSAASTGI
ncbi:MAG TPA: hypothetical protein VGK22_07880 [Candidatus Angelobacter sp.]|jgi:hypothetical protein